MKKLITILICRKFKFWGVYIMSRPAMRPTQPRIQWAPRAVSLGVKRSGHEADHSPSSSADVKAWSYTYTPPIRPHGVVLS